MATPDPTTSSAGLGTETPVTAFPQQGLRGQRLPLAENDPFSYWVDPTRLVVRKGKAFYNPVAVPLARGVLGVGDDGNPGPCEGYQKHELRRVEVPLDFEVQAWGKKVKGYLVKINIGTDLVGKELVHYRDVWTRYSFVGTQVVTEFDHDGFQDFRSRVEKLMGGAPHHQVAAASIASMRAQLDQEQRIAPTSGGSRAVVAQLEAHLGGAAAS